MSTGQKAMMSCRWLLLANLLVIKITIVACFLTTQLHQSRSMHPMNSFISEVRSSASDERNMKMDNSPESTFWQATPQQSTSGPSLPAIDGIDRETGPLPHSSYHTIKFDDNSESSLCLIGIKINPPENPSSGDDIWTDGVKNCQNMIDSGFNTFRIGNSISNEILNHKKKKDNLIRQTKQSLAVAKKLQDQYSARTIERHEFEQQFYNKLRQNTPSSILRSCHFNVDIEVPSSLHVLDQVLDKNKPAPNIQYGDGWAVRKSISDALLRVKSGCLDTVTLEYKPNSPYHLDIINTLCEMKIEGLVRSISTKNFSPSLLQSALRCGFEIYANQYDYNLLMLDDYMQSETKLKSKMEYNHVFSAPLAGGLLTSSFIGKRDIRQLSSSERKLFDSYCLLGVDREEKWAHYRTVIDTLSDISFKHNVSIESVALRSLLQLNTNHMIFVGTKLGMDLAEKRGGLPYNRYRDLRQVFGFSLDDEEIEMLYQDTQHMIDTPRYSSLTTNQSGDFIDFNDQSLWL